MQKKNVQRVKDFCVCTVQKHLYSMSEIHVVITEFHQRVNHASCTGVLFQATGVSH